MAKGEKDINVASTEDNNKRTFVGLQVPRTLYHVQSLKSSIQSSVEVTKEGGYNILGSEACMLTEWTVMVRRGRSQEKMW